jgi:hypothetical protein
MKTTTICVVVLSLLVVLTGCYRPYVTTLPSVPSSDPTAIHPYLVINTVEGDKNNLPGFATNLASIKIGDDPKADAIFISRGLFETAKTDSDLRTWLYNIAFKTIILVYGGDTNEVADILGLKSPAMLMTNSKYAVAVIRATEKSVIGGGILIPKDQNGVLTLQDLNNYILLVEEHTQ